MDSFVIRFNGEEVRLFVEEAIPECSVTCNGSTYEVDILYRLKNTNPERYFSDWNGELWFELFHTCKVDSKQAEDFSIDNKTLFEYKIPNSFFFYDNITEEGYEMRKKTLEQKYSKYGISGFLIHNHGYETHRWNQSKNGNLTTKIGDQYLTIIKSKYDNNYGIVTGENKSIWKYNGKPFQTEEDAKRNADYIAFRLFNGERL